MLTRLALTCILILVVVATTPVLANEISISGFVSFGYAQSDRDYRYQRFIDSNGTLRRDSLAGLQVDSKFAERFGATLQTVLVPSSQDDKAYANNITWAFLSYRPTDDWLFRIGAQRIPFYLYSQSHDVGVTYDFARLPVEMYSISPSNDFRGISLSKTWTHRSGDISLDGYLGKSKFVARFWLRDEIPAMQSAGAFFRKTEFQGGMAVLTFKSDQDVYRLGIVKGHGSLQDGSPLPTRYPFVPLLPGVGYYQVSDAFPGPGVGMSNRIGNTIAMIGVDIGFEKGLRFVGEFARTYVNGSNIDFANASDRGYLALLRQVDKWTPYVTYSFLRSNSRQRSLYQSINRNMLPDLIPGSALINASQRAGADGMLTYDQSSWALGISYSFSAMAKLKMELARSNIGETSSFLDAPSGKNVQNQQINVISVSYSMAF